MAKLLFKLFLAGPANESDQSIVEVRKTLDDNQDFEYDLEVIDVLKSPHMAERCNIIATPTLVLSNLTPRRMIIGDFSIPGKILDGLGLLDFNEKVEKE